MFLGGADLVHSFLVPGQWEEDDVSFFLPSFLSYSNFTYFLAYFWSLTVDILLDHNFD